MTTDEEIYLKAIVKNHQETFEYINKSFDNIYEIIKRLKERIEMVEVNK